MPDFFPEGLRALKDVDSYRLRRHIFSGINIFAALVGFMCGPQISL
jgi:hypothetical protein